MNIQDEIAVDVIDVLKDVVPGFTRSWTALSDDTHNQIVAIVASRIGLKLMEQKIETIKFIQWWAGKAHQAHSTSAHPRDWRRCVDPLCVSLQASLAEMIDIPPGASKATASEP